MRSHELKYNLGGAVRVAILTLGLVAAAVAGFILSGTDAGNSGGGEIGAGGAEAAAATNSSGAGASIVSGKAGTDAGLFGLFRGGGVAHNGAGAGAGTGLKSGSARSGTDFGAGTSRRNEGVGAGPTDRSITTTEGAGGIGRNGAGTGASGSLGFGIGASANASADTGFGGEQSGPGNTNSAVILDSFQSLTQAQQARVMQRCKDVMGSPSRASSNQVALCQTLSAMGKR